MSKPLLSILIVLIFICNAFTKDAIKTWISRCAVKYSLVKTVSPKRVVTIVHCTTISGHFLANPFNIFHKTEALLVILN